MTTKNSNALIMNQHRERNLPFYDIMMSATFYYDITDVIVFLRDNFNVSGIQRVVTMLFKSNYNSTLSDKIEIKYCIFDGSSGVLIEISNKDLNIALNTIAATHPSREDFNKLLDNAVTKNEIILNNNDTFIILGAFWISPNYATLLTRLNNTGVKVGVYIYDIIPITHRKFVHNSTAVAFSGLCLIILSHCDFVMAISEFVAAEVRNVLNSVIKFDIPVYSVPLAHDIDIIPALGSISRKLLAATSEPFVLCVGTIEIRKNHDFLVKVWERLIQTQPGQVPRLVIVGRWGWRVDDLRAMLEQTNYLDDTIIVMSDVADSELSYLYEKCLFTVFPSFVEGWGLPIGESLVHGKLCVASNTSSMPEVGGDFVQYIDPYNLTGGYEVISHLINNPSEVSAAEKRIREDFKPRTWADVAADMGKVISAVPGQAVGRHDARCTLPQGEIITFSHNQAARTSLQELKKLTYQIACYDGWDVAEDFGRWALSRSPRLRFKLQGIEDSRPLRLALRLQLPAPVCRVEVTAMSGGGGDTVVMPNGLPHWYFVTVQSQDDGTVDIKLAIKGTIPKVDPVRILSIGLGSLAIVEEHNFENRMLMMEMIRSVG